MSFFGTPLTSAPVTASDWQEVTLHPLVVLGFADHYTTATASALTLPGSSSSMSKQKVGILLGTHQKKLTDICFTYELIPAATGSSSASLKADVFDKEVAVQRRDMIKAVYAGQEVVGWYIIGSGISESVFDLVNKAVKEVFDVDGPLVAVVDVGAGSGNNKQFPINLLETLSDEAAAKSPSTAAANKAKKISFAFASTESERIGTDTLFRLDNTKRSTKDSGNASGGADQRSLMPLASRLGNSVQLLDACIQTVVGYLENVKNGKISDPDPDTFRLIMAVAQALPFSKANPSGGDAAASGSGDSYNRDFTEGLLLAYVSVLQRSAASVDVMQHLTNQMIDQQSAEGTEELTRGGKRGGNYGPGSAAMLNLGGLMGFF